MDKILSNSRYNESIFETAFTTKLASLLTGIFILMLLSGATAVAFSHLKTAKTQTFKNGAISQTASSNSPSTNDKYVDSKYKFSIQIPQGWEAFKRAGDSTAYQTGIRKIGSVDAPITINSQPNGEHSTLSSFVDGLYGSLYPREKVQIDKKDAFLVRNFLRNYISYFVLNGNNIHEISASTVNGNYLALFNQILPTFTFLK